MHSSALTIRPTNGLYIRYRVFDEASKQYWTGKSWSRSPKDSELYLTPQEAAEVGAAIQRQHFSDKKNQEKFVTSMQIEVFSDSPINVEKLKEWLKEAVSVTVRYADCGTGPDGALVQIRMQIDDLERP